MKILSTKFKGKINGVEGELVMEDSGESITIRNVDSSVMLQIRSEDLDQAILDMTSQAANEFANVDGNER